MAVREYIGARYVPKFDGVHDINKAYEPLTIVTDVGETTSYTSKKSVPVGIALNNTEYWAITGTLSGALLDLQTRVGELEKSPVGRTFIVIGDSFGYGVVGGGAPRGTGWMEGFRQAMANYCDVFYLENPEQYEGVAGFCSTLPFLNILQTIEADIENPDSITDIVVLGGSNDLGVQASLSQLDTAIRNFANYAHSHFKNAEVKIGNLYRRIFDATRTQIAEGYKQCEKYGCVYISDTNALCCIPQYYSSDGTHITAAGYAYYQPYINEAVISGHTHFNFEFASTCTLSSDVFQTDPGISCRYNVTEKNYRMSFYRTSDNKSYPVLLHDTASRNDAIIIDNPASLPLRYRNLGSTVFYNRKNDVVTIGNTGFLYKTDDSHITLNWGNGFVSTSQGDNIMIIDPATSQLVDY